MASLIRRTDEPEIKKKNLGEKKQKDIFAGGKKNILTTFLPDRVDRVKFQKKNSR